MMKQYIPALLAALLLSQFNLSAQTTQKLTATKANDYALIYTLPNTVLDITFETELTESKLGELYLYAKKYLNTDDAIAESSSKVAIKSVTINSRGVADPDKRYSVKFGSSNPPFILIGDQNQPLAVNTERTFSPDNYPLPEPVNAKPSPLETDAARQAVTPDMARSTSIAKRAQLTAESIFSIRESRNDLLTGNSDQQITDGKALQIILDNLSAQEAALTAMFMGTTKSSTQVTTITYTPTDSIANDIIVRVSPTEGIIPPNDLSGEPVYLKLEVTNHASLPIDSKGEELPFPKNGFAYTIPATANVTIQFDGRTLWNGDIDMAQFGIIYGLNPGSFSDRKAPIYVVMDPTTGAIRELGPVKESDDN